ncbi:hypothetical protein, partial [Thiolapillus sp.]|uniref:hypothetical protein n=1 Tax=Thiolapillus sp. TaxID=2017437 RepID=UPI003AF63C12
RENSAASRLLGSTSLRFALHAWQRMRIFFGNDRQMCLSRQAGMSPTLPCRIHIVWWLPAPGITTGKILCSKGSIT